MNYYAKRFFGQQGIVRDGLKLWLDASNPLSYPGSGTTWFDLSGNGNNGTMVNGVVPLSNAMQFDGVNDYVNVNSIIVPDISAFSFSIWVKFISTTSPAFQRIVDISDSTKNFQLALISSNFTTAHSQINADGNGEKHIYTIPNNLWINVVCTYASNTIRLYKNGILLSKTPQAVNINRTAIRSKTTIGGRNDGNILTFFNGTLNDTLVYNKSLTSEEVNQNFESTRHKYGI